MLSRRMKKKREPIPYLEQFRHLKKYLVLAGIKMEAKQVQLMLIVVSGVLCFSFLGYTLFQLSQFEVSITFMIIISVIILTLGSILIFMLVWLGFLMMIDYLKFKRKQAVEEVLPEFLRLVSANHRAGLPLDMSLWKANKPRFGILSEEINQVAKNTYASGELMSPLRQFGEKYDSALLRRVITNIVEGLKTGSDIARLLDEVSTNITTIKNTRKELASEVENYMLFITMTVLCISPLMFSLTFNMTGLIEGVKDTLAQSGSEEGLEQSPIQLNFSEEEQDFGKFFDIFVYLMMVTNSVISVLLMSMVKYGNVRQEIKRIPVYFTVGVVVYLVCKSFFGNFLVI